MRTIGILFIIAAISVFSCKDNQTSEKKEIKQSTASQPKSRLDLMKLVKPVFNSQIIVGEDVKIELTQIEDSLQPDSVHLYYNSKLIETAIGSQLQFTMNTKNSKVGKNSLRIAIYYPGENLEFENRNITLLSDINPELLTCNIVERYHHDRNAFTQGLLIHDGIMYEGTGQYGKSSLRKLDLKTGELISSLNLPEKYFGEGIAVFDDKIIQLTYLSRLGFVYDLEGFNKLHTVQYPTQGWGLTSDGEQLLMSDGSERIYFLDPEFFAEKKRIEIYDHEGPVKMLNELEYIDGKVYANVYQSDYFIIFDPTSGKVLKKIDCSHLVPEEYQNDRERVLNGIAWDESSGKLYLTGKNWPYLYEIELVQP